MQPVEAVAPLMHLADGLADRPDAHPALRERAAIARLLVDPVHRPTSARNYASDLGVRVSTDPREFLIGAAAHIGIDAATAIGQLSGDSLSISWVRDDLEEPLFIGILDALVSFAGCWDVVAHVAAELVGTRRLPVSTRALTYLAAGSAAQGDPRAEALYERSAHIDGAPFVETTMSVVRHAAHVAKRLADPGRAEALLSHRKQLVRDAVLGRDISPGDGAALTGMLLNLEALTATMAADQERALTLVCRAEELLDQGGLVMLDDDRRRRYRAQVVVNKAQLFARQGRWDSSRAVLLEHVRSTRVTHTASLSEALALAGYVAYRCLDHATSIRLLREATGLIAREGAPSRLLRVRQNLAVALYRSGAESEGQSLLDHSECDPCGLDHVTGFTS